MSIKHLTDDLTQGGTIEVPLRESIRERVEAYMAGGLDQPAKPKFAATVMLLRDLDENLNFEVFMMRRAATMAFIPDAVVFPGGGVDDLDWQDPAPWAGPEASEWADLMECDEQTARSVITAAAREMFEECGVLLAGYPDENDACDAHGFSWIDERRKIASREMSFAQFLRERGFVLRSDLLSLRAHWITPQFEPKRYDTYFFAARLPLGQVADGRSSEASAAAWVTPYEILERFKKKEVLLVPPTIANISALSCAKTIEEVFSMEPMSRIMLQPIRTKNGDLVLRGELS